MKNYLRTQAVKASFLGIFVLFILSLVLLNNLSATVKRSGSFSNGYGHGITVDYEGNSYVTGYFWGEVHFGENILTGYEGTRTIFIAKLNSEGEWLWVNRINNFPIVPESD